jgi:hypothetical protein
MQTVPGAISRSSLGIAAVPRGELSGPGHAHQLETGCVQPDKRLGVVQPGNRHQHAVSQVRQAGLDDLAGLHPRDSAHVHALPGVELRAHHPGADDLDLDPAVADLGARACGRLG